MENTSFSAASAARLASVGFIVLSGLALLWVSVLALMDPRAVMALVGVQLPSPDAASSIRGVYGGVGLSICLSLAMAIRRQWLGAALAFLLLLWGFYALARLLTAYVDGPLGAFGTQWLLIEATLALAAAALLGWRRHLGLR